MYQKGLGVDLDYYEAVRWYRKSAEQGNMYGECSLGYMYNYGLGVSQDYDEAIRWYRLAADQGYKHARKNLERAERERGW